MKNFKEYLIIPDLHGQYNIFIKLLSEFVEIKNNKIINNKYKIILLGDLIDKSPQKEQIKLIEFIYNNIENLIIIYGNHDYKTYKKLTTDKDYFLSEFYDFYFQTLIKNEIIKKKFMEIYNNSLLYYEDENIFCNHSPCLKEHIERKKKSLFQYQFNRQKNMSDNEYKKYLKSFFSEITEFNDYKKIHIFGHLGLEKPMVNKNQIWLDTKKVESLTFLHINENLELNFINDKKNINDVFYVNSEEALNKIVESMFYFRKINKIKENND